MWEWVLWWGWDLWIWGFPVSKCRLRGVLELLLHIPANLCAGSWSLEYFQGGWQEWFHPNSKITLLWWWSGLGWRSWNKWNPERVKQKNLSLFLEGKILEERSSFFFFFLEAWLCGFTGGNLSISGWGCSPQCPCCPADGELKHFGLSSFQNCFWVFCWAAQGLCPFRHFTFAIFRSPNSDFWWISLLSSVTHPPHVPAVTKIPPWIFEFCSNPRRAEVAHPARFLGTKLRNAPQPDCLQENLMFHGNKRTTQKQGWWRGVSLQNPWEWNDSVLVTSQFHCLRNLLVLTAWNGTALAFRNCYFL